jgi:effector-binding domain-containing protein
MAATGLDPDGDPREVYLTSPAATPSPEDYLTEVLWPVTG